MSDPELPITALVSTRCKELHLRPVELVRRCGYRNISKGLRRLDSLSHGYFAGTEGLICGLPAGLEVPAQLVQQTVEETKKQIFEAEEAAWRTAFGPHAIILTERQCPHPIFIAAILGVENLRRVDFDLTQGPVSYVRQALQGVGEKVGRSGEVTAFGRATGFVINFSPDHAVRFDLEGKPVEALDRAYRLGQASFHLKGGRVVTPEKWRAVGGEVEIIDTK